MRQVFLKCHTQMVANAGGVFEQTVFLHDANRLHTCAHGQRIAAKGGTMISRMKDLHNGPVGAEGGYRIKATAQGFANTDTVGTDAFMFKGPHFTGSPQSSLNFIQKQENLMLIAEGAKALKIAGRRQDYPGFSLDGFHQNGGGLGGDGGLHGLQGGLDLCRGDHRPDLVDADDRGAGALRRNDTSGDRIKEDEAARRGCHIPPAAAEFRRAGQATVDCDACHRDKVTGLPGYEDATTDLVISVLEEAGKLCENELHPLNRSGDEEGCTWSPEGVKTPKGFFPQDDTGLIFGGTRASPDISFEAMKELQQRATQIVLSDPAVAFIGSSGALMVGGADNSPAVGDQYSGAYGAISWTSVPLWAKFRYPVKAFAVSVVMACGLAMLIMARSLIHSLESTRQEYYEAHRFAVTFHRRARGMRDLGSALDGVPGVGPRRRRTLLSKFGSVAGVRRASREELAAAVGAKVADAVLAFFAGQP